jgi:glycosyltransferase involved in cell wall biosynthesis
VIESNVGGISEAVSDGVTGLLIPPNDPSNLTSAIAELLENPQKRERMGEAARKRVEMFSLELTTRSIERLYREMVR